MNRARKIIAFLTVALVLAFGAWWYLAPAVQPNLASGQTAYTNELYQFSFAAPEGYAVREGDGVVFVEDKKGDGIQILITPIDEDITVMTVERINADIPDMRITDTEPVEIGDARTGLAFKSDNEAFDGASREVWFVYGGYLYQISTYERLDPVLKQLFSTWEFI